MQPFATYTFGQALLTILEFALLFLWIWLAITGGGQQARELEPP